MKRSGVTLAHCPCALLRVLVLVPLLCPRRRSAGFENDPNGAVVERVGAGECVSRRTVRPGKCAGSENDSNGAVVERFGAGDCVSRRSLRPGKCAGSENDSNGALVECDVAGECVSRRTVLAGKALGSADRQAVGSPKSRDLVRQCHNSRIHGSQSSFFACASVSSGALLGAFVVGSASAAVGSVCLPAVRTRTYADVAASACGGMAVMQRHACNSVVSGGFLPVQKSTSYDLGTGRQGPTGTKRVKGGVSGPAEDLRPVPEVVAGVNFRPAGGVRGQVAGSLPGRQPGTGTRTSKGSVVTPSLHPEVPDSLFVSPGPGKRIRQSMGWTKVCGTAQSGIWVLKGNARTCMFPANLDHLRVGWRKQGSYKTAWVTPGHDCLCSYKYGHGAAVRPQTNKAIWDGVISLWGRVAPFLSPWCGKKELPTGVNLNHYDGSRSCVRWHSDNESLFGPRDSPELIVSLSLGNPVEFKVRRVSDSVTSSITLNHGDVLVMDGSAQSEYLHCTMPGLQGPRVNLTYRWVAQHTASCPLAGVVGCLLPSCVQGSAEPGSRLGEKGGNNWSFSWELAFLLFILMSVPLVSIWMNTRKECRHSGQHLSCSSVHFPSRGRARWVGGRRWPLSRRHQSSNGVSFYFHFFYMGETTLLLFSGYGFVSVFTAGYASSQEGAHYMLQ